jgi:hypothetical protein
MALVTYLVEKMRATSPTGKTAERNPDRWKTVTGTFYSTKVDEKGKLVRKDKMSYPVKYVTKEDALTEGFVLDTKNGILTMPAGEKGRKATEGEDQATIDADLEALRKAAAAS